MRRVEVAEKTSGSETTSLTINDERVTVKVGAGQNRGLMMQYAERIAEQIPLDKYPTLRGTIFTDKPTRLRDRSQKYHQLWVDGREN